MTISLKDVQEIQKRVDRIKQDITAIDAHFSGETVSGQTHAILSHLQLTRTVLDGWDISELEEWTP